MSVPAYMIIREYALNLIMRSPDREVKIQSERELCKTFEVTRPTVRKALKDLIDDGFLFIRPGLGTFTNPTRASNLNAHEALSIGIIIGDAKHISYGGFFGDLMIGAIEKIVSCGGNFRILNIMNQGMKAVENIMLHNLDGIVWIIPPPQMVDIINGLEEKGMPLALVNRYYDCNAKVFVGVDYENEGYRAAELFIAEGHENILSVIEPKIVHAPHMRGFRKAFKDAGAKLNENYIIGESDKDIGAKLQKFIDEDFKDITGIYGLRYEILNALEAFCSSKGNSDIKRKAIVLEYITRSKPQIKCSKALEPLKKVGAMAVEKLSERLAGTLTKKTVIKLKAEIKP